MKKGVIEDTREPYWGTRCSAELLPELQDKGGKPGKGDAKAKLEHKAEQGEWSAEHAFSAVSVSCASLLVGNLMGDL